MDSKNDKKVEESVAAEKPADQGDPGHGADGFVSLCYIKHDNLAGEW